MKLIEKSMALTSWKTYVVWKICSSFILILSVVSLLIQQNTNYDPSKAPEIFHIKLQSSALEVENHLWFASKLSDEEKWTSKACGSFKEMITELLFG